MSISSVGFSPFETLPANSLFRVTLAAPTVSSVLDGWGFVAAARVIYKRLKTDTGISPTSYLSVINGDKTTVIDGIIHDATRGADLLNKLEEVGERFAIVSKVELLTGNARAASNGNAGVTDRQKAADDAKAAASANEWWNQLGERFGALGSFIKWGGVIVALIAIAYIVHELKRK